jgi:hypothetical protein
MRNLIIKNITMLSILSLNLNIKKISTPGKMQWFLVKAQKNPKTTAIFAYIYDLAASLDRLIF